MTIYYGYKSNKKLWQAFAVVDKDVICAEGDTMQSAGFNLELKLKELEQEKEKNGKTKKRRLS